MAGIAETELIMKPQRAKMIAVFESSIIAIGRCLRLSSKRNSD